RSHAGRLGESKVASFSPALFAGNQFTRCVRCWRYSRGKFETSSFRRRGRFNCGVVCTSSARRIRRNMAEETCSHLNAITKVKHPTRRECEECVKIGASWVHLRTCQTCGVTLCCDDSPNRHATRHARASEHPVIASAEPGERWLYCYPDDAFVEY